MATAQPLLSLTPGSGKVKKGQVARLTWRQGGSLWPLHGLRTGSLSLEELPLQQQRRNGVERRAGWRAGPGWRGQVSQTPRGGGGRGPRRLGPHHGWDAVCVCLCVSVCVCLYVCVCVCAESGAARGTRKNRRGGERGPTFSCDSGLTQCHF